MKAPIYAAEPGTVCDWTFDGERCQTRQDAVHILTEALAGQPAQTALCGWHSPFGPFIDAPAPEGSPEVLKARREYAKQQLMSRLARQRRDDRRDALTAIVGLAAWLTYVGGGAWTVAALMSWLEPPASVRYPVEVAAFGWLLIKFVVSMIERKSDIQ